MSLDLPKACDARLDFQRGEPNLENELWRVSAAVMNGSLTPEQAGQEIQAGLDKWYKPAQ